jgi:hypothetical protein
MSPNLSLLKIMQIKADFRKNRRWWISRMLTISALTLRPKKGQVANLAIVSFDLGAETGSGFTFLPWFWLKTGLVVWFGGMVSARTVTCPSNRTNQVISPFLTSTPQPLQYPNSNLQSVQLRESAG